LCRAAAEDIAKLKPTLGQAGVRLVGVGLGYDSLEGFIEGNYWGDNELYVDDGKNLYKELKLGTASVAHFTNSTALKKFREARARGTSGNSTGDGMQLGGTYVIAAGGDIIFEFQQQTWGDHPTNDEILEALKLK